MIVLGAAAIEEIMNVLEFAGLDAEVAGATVTASVAGVLESVGLADGVAMSAADIIAPLLLAAA